MEVREGVPGGFAAHPQTSGWALSGLTYFGYNIIGAVVILPVLRHLISDRDAVIAGAIAGPLTMLPALLFFIPMVAFYPEVQSATLPSDFMLQRIGIPAVPPALPGDDLLGTARERDELGSRDQRADRPCAGNARTAGRCRTGSGLASRSCVLVGCMFLASRFGLVALIATGYRALAYILLATFILPLVTVGVWKLWHGPRVRRSSTLPVQE